MTRLCIDRSLLVAVEMVFAEAGPAKNLGKGLKLGGFRLISCSMI